MPSKVEMEEQLKLLQGKLTPLKGHCSTKQLSLREAQDQLCEFEMIGKTP